MTIFNVLSLIGGLALFLFGMNIMGQSLEKTAGSKLKTILSKLTDSPIKGLLLGMTVTCVIQSSSATTVMVVGFVNSGLMQLNQAIGLIMGANIGTTITSWILSLTGISGENILIQLLKPSSFTPILAIIGVAMHMFAKKERKRDIGTILLGFAVLMYGMETMSGAVSPLSNSPTFAKMFTMFSNPILGVAVGTVVTAIIQSSSASVGILQALSATGQVTFGSAIPIIMGQNIGTCVTAFISSIGTNKNARRAAMVHLYFNIIGTLVCLGVFYAVNAFVHFDFLASGIDKVGIAIVHTAFNVVCTFVLLPFTMQLEKLAILTVKDDKESGSAIEVLDSRLINTPSIAVARSREVTCDMAKIAIDSVKKALSLIGAFSEAEYDRVLEMEHETDEYEDRLGAYIVELNSQDLTDADSSETTRLLRCITDFERIGDHAKNIAESANELNDKRMTFSDEAKRDLNVLFEAIGEIMHNALISFTDNATEAAKSVEPLEEVIGNLVNVLRAMHIERLKKGKCTIEQGFVLNDLITSLERISDHCSNIALCQLEDEFDRFDAHAYMSSVKTGDNVEFAHAVKAYGEKYRLK